MTEKIGFGTVSPLLPPFAFRRYAGLPAGGPPHQGLGTRTAREPPGAAVLHIIWANPRFALECQANIKFAHTNGIVRARKCSAAALGGGKNVAAGFSLRLNRRDAGAADCLQSGIILVLLRNQPPIPRRRGKKQATFRR